MEKTGMEQGGTLPLGKVKALVLTGLFAALGCVATMVLVVPSPTGGYMNLGDAVVLLGTYLLGPVCGAVAGGIGPALADLLAGLHRLCPRHAGHQGADGACGGAFVPGAAAQAVGAGGVRRGGGEHHGGWLLAV